MIENENCAELKNKRFLLAHCNTGDFFHQWHDRRKEAATSLGYNIRNFSISEYLPYTTFPSLDKMWRKRDRKLMALYEALGEKIEGCDIFIHYNGTMIHPEFLDQFKKIKVYHCADDPDVSEVMSKPVANHYDICAISNPACMDMYRAWGCKKVFFWPLGAFFYSDEPNGAVPSSVNNKRDIPIVFIGNKFGLTHVRFVGKYLGLYKKKWFMKKIEDKFPELVAYGYGWRRGWIDDAEVSLLYSRSIVGLNVHNSLGPINIRLYDLAAFGICQICDNKPNLHFVFEEGKEIVGFETVEECIDLIHYYLANPEEAEKIGRAGQQRYLRDYTMVAIWKSFFNNLAQSIYNHKSQ